jgi:hypothetical protein
MVSKIFFIANGRRQFSKYKRLIRLVFRLTFISVSP